MQLYFAIYDCRPSTDCCVFDISQISLYLVRLFRYVALSALAALRRHMLLDDLNDFLQVVVRILMIVQSIGKLLERLKEAVEVHLVVVAPSHHVLVDDVVMGLQDVAVGEARVFGQPLELRARDEVVALLTGQYLEHFLGIGV